MKLKEKVIMKKITIPILFTILCMQLVSAQTWRTGSNIFNENKGLIVGVGFNAVNDASSIKIFDMDYWNFSNPFSVSVEYQIDSEFSVAFIASFNRFNEGKNINGYIVSEGSGTSYSAFDLLGKYSFHDLLNSNDFEPYALLGLGHTQTSSFVGDYYEGVYEDITYPAQGNMTFNAGIGCNYWFSPTVGANINGMVKVGLGNNVPSQIQASLGVLFRIPNTGF